MSCLIAPSMSDLFDPVCFVISTRQEFESEPMQMPRTLFDFLTLPARRLKFETVFTPEEDLERWDGLS
jgi:hypothetical protein